MLLSSNDRFGIKNNILNDTEESCFHVVALEGESDVTESDNVILECMEILSFCYLQKKHIRSKLSRHWLGKFGTKTD